MVLCTTGSEHRLAPDVTSGGNEQVELALLHVEAQAVIAIKGCKAALWAEAETVQLDDAPGLVDAAFERLLGFELGNLGTDEAEDGDAVLRQEAQGCEVAGARSVVFKK